MRYGLMLAGIVGLMLVLVGQDMAPAQTDAVPVQWIWFNEGSGQDALAGTRYFRRAFEINRPLARPVDEGTLDITADNEFTVWVNGVEVGKGNNFQKVYQLDVTKHLVHGRNAVAVEAKNTTEGPAGLLVRLAYVPNGQSRMALVSDGSWKASKEAKEGWQKVDFNEEGWTAVKVIGPYGQVAAWKNVTWGTGNDRFTVPPGFVVEMVVPPNPKLNDPVSGLSFSLVNLCFDAKGRLLVSREMARGERGGKPQAMAGEVYLCTEPDKAGVFQNIKVYCDQVRNCQGMCWVRDALLLVGDGPQGTGLYRVRDTNGDDQTDEVKLLHKFRGGMGEHGPHAIIHGPDDWLYLVIGNHAWAQIGPEAAKNGVNPAKLADNSPLVRWPTGHFGPDQGKPGTTEDVLLPRLNDGRGHAADILAPGGTIWRLDHEGKNWSLVTAGFRNHYDAAFNQADELFTFDSDMEWDEGLPWYRAVRVCHCPPGADFVWRTGAANTPDYYIDSLPPTVETGRGSPVGVEFYDHIQFPEKYHGAFFMADWAIGVIFAVHLERDGASYKGKVERFCVGAPMNVTDLVVGPDGALYFSLGGRGTQGGVFRITYRGAPQATTPPPRGPRQPLSPWGRKASEEEFRDPAKPNPQRADWLYSRLVAKDPEWRAHAVWEIGARGYKTLVMSDGKPPRQETTISSRDALVRALKDQDALVRRRACEALIRAAIEPPVDDIWPLLNDTDRFVRTAARLVLQRIDPAKWADRITTELRDQAACEAIIALCKINRAKEHAEAIYARLAGMFPFDTPSQLQLVRTMQMALIHAGPDAKTKELAKWCSGRFPHEDWRMNRELAILLTHFRREKILDEPVHAKLLEELRKPQTDGLGVDHHHQQQIHYAYCLRLLQEGWRSEQKLALLRWYESTHDWSGGHSFGPFLENILREMIPIFNSHEREQIIAQAEKLPKTATLFLMSSPEGQKLPPTRLADIYVSMMKSGTPPSAELKESILNALQKPRGPEVQAALRKIADADPGQHVAIGRALARFPSKENFPYLVLGLQSPSSEFVGDLIEVLKKTPAKPTLSKEPKPEEAAPYRTLLLASTKLEPKQRWKAVELLRYWSNGREFGAEPGEWKMELDAWAKWFAQTFPREPPLPNLASDKPVAQAESKYKFDELLAFLEKDGKSGDVKRGKLIFEKATCIKCHKFGKEGEGIGPDLTTVKSRFNRRDLLESIHAPSKVISDQYRGTNYYLKNGTLVGGLAAPQGNQIVILKIDGTKETIKAADIDRQFASTISAMPERLLDELTLAEIADLFAYMESEPGK